MSNLNEITEIMIIIIIAGVDEWCHYKVIYLTNYK